MPPLLPRLYTPLLRTSYRLPLHSLVLLYTPTVWSLLQYTSTHAPATILLLLLLYYCPIVPHAARPATWQVTRHRPAGPEAGTSSPPILKSHFQVLLSRVGTSHFQVLVPLVSRARTFHPQVSVYRVGTSHFPCHPLPFRREHWPQTCSDHFLGGTRWCVPVWRTYDTKLDLCDKIWQRIGVGAKTELSFEKLWRFSGRNLH